jgi:hypothetical protein
MARSSVLRMVCGSRLLMVPPRGVHPKFIESWLGSGATRGNGMRPAIFSLGWFTEGFDTLDLKEAKALLDELAA